MFALCISLYLVPFSLSHARQSLKYLTVSNSRLTGLTVFRMFVIIGCFFRRFPLWLEPCLGKLSTVQPSQNEALQIIWCAYKSFKNFCQHVIKTFLHFHFSSFLKLFPFGSFWFYYFSKSNMQIHPWEHFFFIKMPMITGTIYVHFSIF